MDTTAHATDADNVLAPHGHYEHHALLQLERQQIQQKVARHRSRKQQQRAAQDAAAEHALQLQRTRQLTRAQVQRHRQRRRQEQQHATHEDAQISEVACTMHDAVPASHVNDEDAVPA